jgi:hypothetical protein
VTRYRSVTTLAIMVAALLTFAAPAHAASLRAAPSVKAAAHRIAAKAAFSGQMIGIAARPGNKRSDHPSGYAVDFMVDSKAEGDRVAAACRSNGQVSYVLWRVPAHFDHVHCSFKRR